MHKIYHGFWELIGNTPLVRVERYQKENGLNAEILVKLEALNPAGSVKRSRRAWDDRRGGSTGKACPRGIDY